MKVFLIFAFVIGGLSVVAQEHVIPRGFGVLAEKTGDLDKDGIPEKVIVYNTTDTTDEGITRKLYILKYVDSKWIGWKQSANAVLKSQQGGMMGDPFEGIEVKNGLLIVSVAGGSSWKWAHQDKYRFQNNEFELIGYTSNAGKPCEYWTDIDFNISTGKIIYKKEYEDCDKNQEIYKRETETFYRKSIRLNLKNRYLKEIKIVLPKYKHELYL